MFVGSTFPEDQDRELMGVQHDLWFKINGAWIDENGFAMGTCFYIFSCARKAIMSLTGGNPMFFPEREKLPNISNFDHRVLLGFHERIASFYRWRIQAVKPTAFSHDSANNKIYYLDMWKTYLRHEIAHITFGRIDIAEQIVRAVIFQNTEEGYAAEDRIILDLEERYGQAFKLDRKRLPSYLKNSHENEGFIYVMVSPALKENFLKIGKTTRTPQKRAQEISVGTGVPLRFYVIFQVLVSDCHEVEKLVHAKLAHHRSTSSREFFEISLDSAIEVIRAIALNYPPNPALNRIASSQRVIG